MNTSAKGARGELSSRHFQLELAIGAVLLWSVPTHRRIFSARNVQKEKTAAYTAARS